MPQTDDLAVALARLGALSPGPEVNIRPVLLRTVVDLFLLRPTHAPADLKTFEAMVGPLLEQADAETRRAVADKLIKHPETPRSLLDHLVDEPMLAAAEMFRHAPLDDDELLTAAERGPVTVAIMIAHRATLADPVVAALAARSEPLIALALASNRALPFDAALFAEFVQRARTDRTLAERLAARASDPVALAPLFPLLGPERRRGIIEAVRRLDLGRREWGRPDGATPDTLDRLDRLVLSGEWDGFDHVLCQALLAEETALRPLLHDGTGDVLALALAGVGAPGAMAARAFILGDPAIGRSVAAVRRLTGLVDTVAPTAARRLLGAMLAGNDKPQRRGASPAKPLPVPRRPEVAASEPVSHRRGLVETPLRRRG